MSQFILVDRAVSSDGVQLRSLDDFLCGVATRSFGTSEGCFLVTDAQGRCEPLIDAVWAARSNGDDVESTPLMKWLRAVVESGARFVIWCASDVADLPTARSWREVVDEMKAQTTHQPADVFLRFSGRDV